MKARRHLVIFSCLLWGIIGCTPSVDVVQETARLLDTDRAFAAYSVEHGMANAFQKYMAEAGLQLPAGQQPIRGNANIFAALNEADPAFILDWIPQEGGVAASGDLGYTWGRYTYARGDSVWSHGKYLNVWRKQADGTWRVLIDTGNQNPPPTTD